MKCLAKSPDHRYATGDDLRIDLLRFREGRAVGATGPAHGTAPVGGRHPGRPGPRHPGLAAVGGDDLDGAEEPSRTGLYAAILVVLLVALAVVIIFLGNSVGLVAHGGGPEHDRGHARRDGPERDHGRADPAARRPQDHGAVRPVRHGHPNTQVLRTDPAKGTTVKKGDTVTLVTGAQGPPVHVPDLVGQSVTSAKAAAAADGAPGQRPVQQHLHPAEHRLHAEPEVGPDRTARGHGHHLHAVDDDAPSPMSVGSARPRRATGWAKPASSAGPSPPSRRRRCPRTT